MASSAFGQSEIRFRNYTISNGLSQSSVTCIIQDDLNSFWIGTQDGLNRYDGKTFEIFTSSDTEGLESEYIRCAEKDTDGNLWFGTNNGLTKYDIKRENFTTYTYKNGVALQIEDIAVEKVEQFGLQVQKQESIVLAQNQSPSGPTSL